MPEEQKDDRCTHINRVPVVVKGKHIGSPSMGQCEKDAVAGMNVCYKHADREAMAYHITNLWKKVAKLETDAKSMLLRQDMHTRNLSKKIKELKADAKSMWLRHGI